MSSPLTKTISNVSQRYRDLRGLEILSTSLRAFELCLAGIVAGINGSFVRHVALVGGGSFGAHGGQGESWLGRFIYAEIVAVLGLFFAIALLLPPAWEFQLWPVDLFMALAWFAAFGVIIDDIYPLDTCGKVYSWGGFLVTGKTYCVEWKVVAAFCFVSGACWFASTLLGGYWLKDDKRPYHLGIGRRQRPSKTTSQV